MSPNRQKVFRLASKATGLLLVGAALTTLFTRVAKAEPASCLSPNPADWPAPAKPYFMVIVDTSGSMAACTNPQTAWPQTCADVGGGINNSCGWQPLRVNDAKCALRNTLYAFAGEANFGLASFSRTTTSCPTACNWGEFWTGSFWYRYAYNGCNFGGTACGGANMLVGVLQDSAPPPATNVPSMVQYMDNNCGDAKELFAYDATPIGASLQNVRTYFQNGIQGFPSPLNASDPPCRSLNVILMTDGGETCSGDPVTAAQQLYNGFTKDGIFRRIYTHVIAFNVDQPSDQTLLNNVHKMGQCGSTTGSCANGVNALQASNEVTLSQAFAEVISGAIKPETCDNADNNCNGCTDEGYQHYCNVKPASQCCTWSTQAQRTTCLNNYKASITGANPNGDLTLLPCTTAAQQTQPQNWLCYDPKELCDNADNNCNGTADEGFNKCGSPAHCPQTETCNGEDDDCDAIIDNASGNGVPYSACPNNCQPSAEICDGCDNDCDGIADNGVADIDCGFSPPSNCAGKRVCQSKGTAVAVGGCVGSGVPKGFGTCGDNPATEVCDGLDNNCNGTVDEGIAPTSCEVPGQPGLTYKDAAHPNTQCVKGQKPCNGTCSGWIGPSPEVCDGIDNDCDGVVDDGVPGVGNACGTATGQCQKGSTACVGGVLVCQGGVQPQPESCNGLDDNCDGTADNAPLTDQPSYSGLLAERRQLLPAPESALVPAGRRHLQRRRLADRTLPDRLFGVRRRNGWKCQGGKAPTPEVCDDVDNNCNGTKDDGLGSPVGDSCGTNVGECTLGVNICDKGVIKCNGQGGTAEICDGKDNDCDGTIDNGLPIGGSCTPTYDTNLYPGDRTKGECKPGVNQCDPQNPTVPTCVGGQGPEPEVCDGKDNDCDGQIDESGPAPDGIDGTTNPLDPSQKIGDACGTNEGECKQGTLSCSQGKFVCTGGVGPQPESCDCLDNDCNGKIDDEAPATRQRQRRGTVQPGQDLRRGAGRPVPVRRPLRHGRIPLPHRQRVQAGQRQRHRSTRR